MGLSRRADTGAPLPLGDWPCHVCSVRNNKRSGRKWKACICGRCGSVGRAARVRGSRRRQAKWLAHNSNAIQLSWLDLYLPYYASCPLAIDVLLVAIVKAGALKCQSILLCLLLIHPHCLWATRAGVQLEFIRPGRPMENGHVESFNGKFREECLNAHAFRSLPEGRDIIEAWRQDYNTARPHTSLGGWAPEEYARAMNEENQTSQSPNLWMVYSAG